MKDSQAGAPELLPVGSFKADCSPYGVRDMCGGVIEWCAGPFNKDGILGIQRGGFWLASEANCRLARRFGVFPTEPEKFCGFRVAFTPED
jgi:formylglycine-generating enzyme required for sulfatase activity